MKALTALLLVQTGVLILLFVKLVAVENSVAETVDPAPRSASGTVFAGPVARGDSLSGDADLSELRLREIIREELAAHAVMSPRPAADGTSKAAPEPTYTAENQYQLERVNQQLDYFESTGTISNREMQDLQAEIVKLHAADRRHMLNRLTQSMNAGRIKGLM